MLEIGILNGSQIIFHKLQERDGMEIDNVEEAILQKAPETQFLRAGGLHKGRISINSSYVPSKEGDPMTIYSMGFRKNFIQLFFTFLNFLLIYLKVKRKMIQCGQEKANRNERKVKKATATLYAAQNTQTQGKIGLFSVTICYILTG